MKQINKCAATIILSLTITAGLAQSWGDYTLYSIQNSQAAYLININNTVYHTWSFSSSNKTGYSLYLLPGGELLRTVRYTPNSFTGGGQTGKLQKVAWDGTILWDFVYSTSTYSMHHDICPMPNGNVLLICYESKTAAQATQAGSSQNIVIWSEKIVEVKQTGLTTGEVVWEWHLWDHLVQNLYPTKDNYETTIVNHPDRININYKTSKDWIHMNGIDYNPILDQITFSSHNLNEIYIIDHSTTTAEAASASGGNSGKGGRILYRWGNPAAYQATGTTIFNVVHDARWIPETAPNAGRLVAYNNKGIATPKSTVDQFMPPRIEYLYSINPGSAYSPATFDERHICNGYSSNQSGSQSLPNGNMLISMAMSGLMYEINPSGTTIWTKQVSGTIAKSYRYNACYVSNPAPAIPEVTIVGNQLISTEAVTYQWYRNGDLIAGANSQTYTPTQSGIYLVRITDTNGCIFQYSKGVSFAYTNMHSITAVPNIQTYGHVVGTGSYNHGDQVTLTAVPKAYSQFMHWTENDQLISNSPVYSFVANQTRALVAHFAVKSYSIPSEFDLTDTGSGEDINTGIDDEIPPSDNKVLIYPNPTNGVLKIQTGKIDSVEVFNLQGLPVNVGYNTDILDFSEVDNGTYLLRITSGKGLTIHRIIVLK